MLVTHYTLSYNSSKQMPSFKFSCRYDLLLSITGKKIFQRACFCTKHPLEILIMGKKFQYHKRSITSNCYTLNSPFKVILSKTNNHRLKVFFKGCFPNSFLEIMVPVQVWMLKESSSTPRKVCCDSDFTFQKDYSSSLCIKLYMHYYL